MSTPSRSLARTTSELQFPYKSKNRDTSPDRTVVWSEPLHSRHKSSRKVPVVYYLSRNGQLEHPHFIEVPLSSPDGLYLRDVISRLNSLRGKAMASMYSWSCKRSYKNGYVWHDLAENDYIYPAHGHEYVLKGSEILEDGLLSKLDETLAPPSTVKNSSPGNGKYGGEVDFPGRRRHQSWGSFDLQEYYKVYKTESPGESSARAAADASTQTEDKRRRRRSGTIAEEEEEEEEEERSKEVADEIQLSKEEISPPPSDSSPETLETLMKADGRLILPVNEDPTAVSQTSAKSKASSVFMQFLSCGAMSFKDCGPGYLKENGFNIITHYKTRLPRDQSSSLLRKDVGNNTVETADRSGGGRGKVVVVEDKEYFSGSLVETKKTEFPALKRSSSYNADRSTGMVVMEKKIEGVKAKCIPRRPRTHSTKKEGNNDLSCDSTNSSCNSQHECK